MRHMLLLALILPLLAQAQSWAPIGATWTYKQGSCCGPDTNLAVIQAMGDTMIEGRQCSRVVMTEGWSVCFSHVRYFHEANDSLWYWDASSEEFHLLFRWDATPGESWWTRVAGGPDQGSPIDTLDWVVLDTSHVVVAGTVLRTYSVQVMPRLWYLIAPIDQVTERLGPGHSPFTWVSGVCDAESYTQLRCYEDNDISWQSPSVPQCALSTGITDHGSGAYLNISPNPAQAGDPITVRFDGQATGDHLVVVHDALGRPVHRERITGERMDLLLPTSGVYLLTLHRSVLPIAQQRLVVR